MSSERIQSNPTLASGLNHIQREAQPLEHEGTGLFREQLELRLRGSSEEKVTRTRTRVGPQMRLVRGHAVDSTWSPETGVRNRKTHGTANRVATRRALRLTQLVGVHRGSVPANLVWKQILHGPTCELPLTTRQDIPWHLGSPTLSRLKWPPATARRSWAMRQPMKPNRLRGPFVVLNANPTLPTALAKLPTSLRLGATFLFPEGLPTRCP